MAEEYSDEELEQILERVHEWGREWSESKYFQDLDDDQKEEAEFVVGSFGEYMYSYHGLTPEEWDEETLEECCLDTLARKISAEEAYYSAMAPVLSSYLTFLAETGRLPQGFHHALHRIGGGWQFQDMGDRKGEKVGTRQPG